MGHFLQRRKSEWNKLKLGLRSWRAGFEQRRLAEKMQLGEKQELIVFFSATVHECNGGLMSIASLAAATRKVHPEALTVMASLPGDPTVTRMDSFPNDEVVLTLPVIMRQFRPVKLYLHIPEMCADGFCRSLSKNGREWLKAIPELHINILNQNIAYMRPREAWQEFFSLTDRITQTTAHKKYTNQEICNRFGIPLHRFGTYMDRSKWPKLKFSEKEKLIVISPDRNEYRDAVLAKIASGLKDYRVQEVHDLSFNQYLDLISRAMFVISFGEGYDGYFNQPPFTNTIGITVYNEEFFPSPEWRRLKNVYATYTDMIGRVVDDVRSFGRDERTYYNVIAEHMSARETIGAVMNEAGYLNNIRRFYEGNFDFLPLKGAAK